VCRSTIKTIVVASATQHRIHVLIVRRLLSAGTTQEKMPGDFTESSGIGDDDEARLGCSSCLKGISVMIA
jgi:hypothetical protein